MPLYHTDDQALLADTARDFLAAEAPVAHLRALRDAGDPAGFDRALWRRFGEMGFAGALVAEADGGLGLGQAEAAIILEHIGRNLSPSPFLGTGVGAVAALNHGDADLRARWLPGIVAGETVAALAIDEAGRHWPEHIAMRAERSGNGFRLTGAKPCVIQGAAADLLIVAARTAGSADEADGITLFAVPADAAGLDRDAVRLVDSGVAAHMRFDGVAVDADAVIGEVDAGAAPLNALLRATRAGAAAEAVGVGQGAMDMTVGYLKQRRQFGRLIGEFQALQHRAAHLYAEIEIARAAMMKAAELIDAHDETADLMVSVAKAKAARAANLAVREGVQMHGGIGMTDEYDIGFFMKRERALADYMGDAYYHAERVARLSGY